MISILPDNILRCMSPEDRRHLGKAGVTAQEAQERFAAGEEKKLQGQVANYLSLLGVYFESDRMDKKTSGAKGRPDFRLCYRGRFVALECKVRGGRVSPEQQGALQKISKSGGIGRVVWSLSDVQGVLRAIDEEDKPKGVLA